MLFIIPVGLIASCFRSAARDREQEVQYVQPVAQQRVVVVNHQQHRVLQPGQYYSCPPPAPPPPGAAYQQRYHPQQPPPPYASAQAQVSQPGLSAQHTTYRPAPSVNHQQQVSPTLQGESRPSQRRKPWQRRNKDGYMYTVLES